MFDFFRRLMNRGPMEPTSITKGRGPTRLLRSIEGEPHLELGRWWRETAQSVSRPPNPQSLVEGIEQRYAISLPEEFRRYLLETAPAEDLWDDGDITWWSVDHVKNIPDEYEHEIRNEEIASEASSYLFFGDYLIWCWAWVICCSEGPNRGRIAVIRGSLDEFVAETFPEFVSKYLQHPEETSAP